MIRFGSLNDKRSLDRWNQKELLQTTKNREAHNMLNICHATHASRVNSYVHKHERAGPQPFAASPPRQWRNHESDHSIVTPHIRPQKKSLQILVFWT